MFLYTAETSSLFNNIFSNNQIFALWYGYCLTDMFFFIFYYPLGCILWDKSSKLSKLNKFLELDFKNKNLFCWQCQLCICTFLITFVNFFFILLFPSLSEFHHYYLFNLPSMLVLLVFQFWFKGSSFGIGVTNKRELPSTGHDNLFIDRTNNCW